MTVTITESTFYIGMTIFLLVLQVFQQFQIRKLQKEIHKLWEHAATAAIVIFTKTEELEKKIKDKE